MEKVGEELATASALFEQICSNLLQCQRFTSLYPKAHPRVQAALALIRTGLEEYHRETAEPFLLEVSETLEESHEAEEEARKGDEYELARLLELRLIERLTLPLDVTEDDLFDFCNLLRDDVLSQPEKRDQVLVDLSQLHHIHLAFYQAEELPAIIPTEDGDDESPSSSRSVRQSSDLDELVNSFSEELREPLRQALEDRRVRSNVSKLKERFAADGSGKKRSRKRRAEKSSEESPEKSVHLLEEIVRTVVRTAETGDENSRTSDSIREKLCNVVEFFTENAESLEKKLDVLPGSGEGSPLRYIAELTEASPRLSEQIKKILEQKEKVAPLFRAAGDRIPMPAQSPAGEKTRERDDDGDRSVDPADRLAQIECDIEAIQRSITNPYPLVPYLQIVLDLLERDETRESVCSNLKRIHRTIAESSFDRQQTRSLVSALSRSLVCYDSEEGRELLLTVLENVDSTAEQVKMFEEAIHREGRAELTEKILREFTDRHRQSAVHFLCALAITQDRGLHGLAVRRLVGLAKNPALLAAWTAEDPMSVLKRETFEMVVEMVGPSRLPGAFRDFFKNATYKQANEFVSFLDPQAAGMEEVLLAAVEFGSDVMRRTALGQLYNFPSPMVITTLMETVKRNNYQETTDLDEDKGAVSALPKIDEVRPRDFLKEVKSRRRLFRYQYRKKIREVLSVLREKEGDLT